MLRIALYALSLLLLLGCTNRQEEGKPSETRTSNPFPASGMRAESDTAPQAAPEQPPHPPEQPGKER